MQRKIPFPENFRKGILKYIGGRRRAPADVLKHFVRGASVTGSMVQAAIRELVAAGELAYTFEHGHTFLEPSFDRPVRVAERIVLSPPGKVFQPGTGDAVIRIMAGASFGGGRHPTTRLALQGIEFALRRERALLRLPGSRVLDIGTGTGVLAIAAVLLGIESGLGIDIDPCAASEAKENIRLNNLEGRIGISIQPVEDVAQTFTLIAANLRPPTLIRLSAQIASLAESLAAVVLSGMRTHEYEGVSSAYEGLGFMCLWTGEEDEWAAAAFRKDT
ncbi:MAG: 50S ribosomal protein L11 methyltransferase [Hyphomicrobiales bacterium]